MATARKKTKKVNAAFMAELKPSAALALVVGEKPLPRTQVVKKMWIYIKKHNLQDKKNRRMINTDETLKYLFDNNDQVSMFDMNKYLKKHLKSL